MRYMRLEENAMEHPKFIAISDKAFRLWCEGCAYCQKHLTDGRIPVKALKGFRYHTPTALRELLTENVPNKGPLWHRDGTEVVVHDYLDWNDTREKVLANRKAGKDRLDRWRAEQAKKRGETPPNETRYETPNETARDVPSKQNGTEQEKKIKSTDAARRPVEITEGTFALYCRIADEARKTSNSRDHDDSFSNVTAIFKDLCGTRRIAYDTDSASKALEAVMRAAVAS